MIRWVYFVLLTASLSAQFDQWTTESPGIYQMSFPGLDLSQREITLYQNTVSKTVIYLYPDGSSSDILRQKIALRLKSDFNALVTSCRHLSSAMIFNTSYADRVVKSAYLARYYDKPYYKGLAVLDHSESDIIKFPDVTPVLKIAVIPWHTLSEIAESQNFIPEYDAVILLSPRADELPGNMITEKLVKKGKLLIIGSNSQKSYMSHIAQKLGGKSLAYRRAGSNYEMFFRVYSIYADMLKWINDNQNG